MFTMPQSRTIPALLREQARVYGHREALVAGDCRLTYAQLREQVLLTARALSALGVRRGDPVAILMGNRAEWVLSFLAVQQLGAVSVGLNTWATARELEFALAHAEISCLIAVDGFRRSDYRGLLADMSPRESRLPNLRRIVWLAADPAHNLELDTACGEIGWDDFMAGGQTVAQAVVEAAAEQSQPDDVGMLLYTSGSTATPKGILLQHGHWITNSFHIGERQHVTCQDRLWLAVSLFWSFGCVNALPNILTHGACVVLQEHFDPGQALMLMEQERCSIIYATPNMVQAMLEHPQRLQRDLSTLRSGATIGTPEQIAQVLELGVSQICNIYGLSETYGNCAVTDAAEPVDVRLQSVGQPLPGVSARICDMETGQLLPTGQVGEIRIKGPLFLSYFKEPEKTRQSYDAEGYFCTGDLGLLDEQGRLYDRGRLKEMVKSGGINIAPAEVEEVLMRHPAVQSAYVIGVPHPTLDEALVAVVIARAGAQAQADELKTYCQRELAAYKVPSRFHFTTVDRLPLTTTGKLQKMKLHTLLD
jgi:fatty-acyl-CoA synthase